ncbi:hypothetical protein PsorP6_006813 [Peronosclerospora sorghi]|uniref:Uncharacterized protein n=1 Tax=Peronosclerospora sorghi TaxID=230839 RepID=A0ACC0WCP7_9STRA|nr:hypothetical protein PsorP6_006813 [Peronosclerospora sorghi]
MIKRASEWLNSQVDPARCFAHFIVAKSEVNYTSRTQHEVLNPYSSVMRRLNELRECAKSDIHFPFALNVPPTPHYDDSKSVTSGEDLRVVTAAWRRYFHVVGTNYFSGRIAPSLSPGQVEVYGVLHVDAGGHSGRLRSESDAGAAEMIFDVRERWRHSKRKRQVNVALNSSDFYSHEYAGFGRQQVLETVAKLDMENSKITNAGILQHPCFFNGYLAALESMNATLEGKGNAFECMARLRSLVTSSNAKCPGENYCFLNSKPQPRGFGSFYASGVLRLAVLGASRVLEHVSTTQKEANMVQLELPNPALLTIRNAANNLCALSFKDVAAALAPHLYTSKPSSLASDLEREIEPPGVLCFDLCYTVVLLEQIGIKDDDGRVHFVERFEKQPELSGHGSLANGEHGSSSELVAWLTGTFLYLEALQRKATFSNESDLLAEQLSAGLPLGWNLSVVVFVAACVFLYLTTGRVAIARRQNSDNYQRVVNLGAKMKYKDTTQAVTFVDDARD